MCVLATVGGCERDELTKAGYTHTVVVVDYWEFTDIVDLVDFKNEFAAQTYADAVNLTQRPYLYA